MPPAQVPGARVLAARVLERVWEGDAFAAAALDAEIRRHPQLDPRDIGLATELVYGVLRTEGVLDERILAASTRKKRGDMPAVARAHLLMGAYALLFLDRVPEFAAVSEAVEGVASATDRRVAGFANAVLRKIAATRAEQRPEIGAAVLASTPGWLRGALRRALGRAGATAYLAAGPVPPPAGICLAEGEDREAWLARLRAAAPGAEIAAGIASPRAITVRGGGDARRLPGAGDAWIVQEEGSQVVALALGARPGEVVLDACAGRGNKAWTLAGGPEGARAIVDAADLHPSKLERLRDIVRLARAVYAVDWTVGPGEVPGGYDRVLVDAPCSGVGTLRRRPEIARRRDASDLERLGALQAEIVRAAATRARDGGRLVYSVCSVLREEAEDVVAALLRDEPGAPKLEPAPFDAEPLRALAGEATALRLLPHVHGTDGYFLASFVVRAAR